MLEYKVEKISSDFAASIEKMLNEYANDGYEVVSLCPHSNTSGHFVYVVMVRMVWEHEEENAAMEAMTTCTSCTVCGKTILGRGPRVCTDCMTDEEKLAAAGDSRAWDGEEKYFDGDE